MLDLSLLFKNSIVLDKNSGETSAGWLLANYNKLSSEISFETTEKLNTAVFPLLYFNTSLRKIPHKIYANYGKYISILRLAIALSEDSHLYNFKPPSQKIETNNLFTIYYLAKQFKVKSDSLVKSRIDPYTAVIETAYNIFY